MRASARSVSALHLACGFLLAVAAWLSLPLMALGQTSARIATADVALTVTAGKSAPQVLTLSRSQEHLWMNLCAAALPGWVERGNEHLPLTWTFNAAASHAGPGHVVFVYESRQPHLRLRWEWIARAKFGPVEHTIVLQNLTGDAYWLPIPDSLRLDWRVPAATKLLHFYVEKGAGAPSDAGTHLLAAAPGYDWTGHSTTFAHPVAGEAREIIPYEAVYEATGGQAGWYSGIEFSGRTRLRLQRGDNHLTSQIGLDPEPGPAVTRLAPGGSFATPTVFLGAFTGGPDGAGNQLRPWVRTVLGSPRTWSDPHYPMVVNNSWGVGMDINESTADRMIDSAASLGFEMFHLDAGWFRGVGDWYADPRKFPRGIGAVADDAHRHGMRFGLWVDWSQAGLDTEPGALNLRDPRVRDWLVADVAPDWKPQDFKGQTIDLGVPAAREYAAHEVNRIVTDDRLDMLEHDGYLVAQGCTRDDHPHAPPDAQHMLVQHYDGEDIVLSSNSTDVSYHAVEAYYGIYAALRRLHPGLLFEICNDGGRMVDFGSAAHGDYFSITDSYDPLSNRRAFYDASYVLPPAMLEDYVEKQPTPTLARFLYELRSGMMGWISVMQDTSAWTPEQQAAARDAIALYKKKLRPLIRSAQLFHIAPRPDGVHWDGMEYFDPTRQEGVVYAFRGSVPEESEHRFVLAGLARSAEYGLHFEDGSSPDTVASGEELMTRGVRVALASPLSSELVFVSARE